MDGEQRSTLGGRGVRRRRSTVIKAQCAHFILIKNMYGNWCGGGVWWRICVFVCIFHITLYWRYNLIEPCVRQNSQSVSHDLLVCVRYVTSNIVFTTQINVCELTRDMLCMDAIDSDSTYKRRTTISLAPCVERNSLIHQKARNNIRITESPIFQLQHLRIVCSAPQRCRYPCKKKKHKHI